MKYTATKVKHTWSEYPVCVVADSEAEAAKKSLGVDKVERICVGNRTVGESVFYFSATRKNAGIAVCDIKETNE